MNINHARESSLNAALMQVEQLFNPANQSDSRKPLQQVESISTGIKELDEKLGIGGLPLGRIVELYGTAGAGKSTVALTLINNAQKQLKQALFVDAEHSLDVAYAESLGVNVNDLLISQPKTGEEAFCIIETLICTGHVDLVVVDSLAALVPKLELEGEMGADHFNLLARLTSQAMKRISVSAKKHNCLVLFLNQIRFNITPDRTFEVTPGGGAIKHYADIRLDLRRRETLRNKATAEPTGCSSRLKIVRNKFLASGNNNGQVKGVVEKGRYSSAADFEVKKTGQSFVEFVDIQILFGKGVITNDN